MGEYSLIGFQQKYAATILSWILDGNEASNWAGLDQTPGDPSIFERWHADPDVRAWVLLRGEDPVGYGEVWERGECETAELARIVIAPEVRNQRLARMLIDGLCATLPLTEARKAVVRVRPNNGRALRCYAGADFHRVSAEQEALYNAGQPVEYVWLSRTIDPALKSSDR